MEYQNKINIQIQEKNLNISYYSDIFPFTEEEDQYIDWLITTRDIQQENKMQEETILLWKGWDANSCEEYHSIDI